MKTCLLKATSDRKIKYAIFPSNVHQETELFEKSKHLLKHASPVSDSRFQLYKVTGIHTALAAPAVTNGTDNSAFVLLALCSRTRALDTLSLSFAAPEC